MWEYCGCQSVAAIDQWPREPLDSIAMLRAHLLKEKDGIFPAAPTTLNATDWQTVEDVRAAVGSALVGTP